jgi:NAD(P)-dependent dehydrogenase (short-subunit alcohol dehydrogenase family)
VVLFGSIAAVRGRGRNVAYAAAKRGLESLQESLRQRYAPQQLRVQLYRLGFLATNLTHGMSLPTSATEPARIARTVATRLTRGSARWYLPRRFALVALIVRCLPWPLYRRMRG